MADVAAVVEEERLDVLTKTESTQELLLQRRADCKDSWPGQWDVSSAGHISAGDSSLVSAQRELQEELGISLPKDAFEPIFTFLQECVINDGKLTYNEFYDVYLVTTVDPIPLEAFTLQARKIETEVSAVNYISYEEYRSFLAKEDPDYVPYDVNEHYGQLFNVIRQRYTVNTVARSLSLQKQLCRYAPVSLNAELTGLSDADIKALGLLIKAAKFMDEIFSLQVWYSNPALRDWLKEHAGASELDKLKWMYYLINKSPWSCLDENEAFLTTTDSAIKLLPQATKAVSGWKGLEYKAAFPILKPPGANFYPPDMDKMEFELWADSLPENQQNDATSFFTVIKRHSELSLDSSLPSHVVHGTNYLAGTLDLYSVPYSKEYNSYLSKAAELLHEAGDLAGSPSLKRLLHSKADSFLSNDYYESDIAWMELEEGGIRKGAREALGSLLRSSFSMSTKDSKLDVTIGPYETYEDTIFGYKATFEAFIGVRDDKATAQLKLFGDNLQFLEQNLPMDNTYKSKHVNAAPIRVIQLVYNAGDVKGPQTVAFNLPNDERIVKDRGTSMVMLKNVSEAKVPTARVGELEFFLLNEKVACLILKRRDVSSIVEMYLKSSLLGLDIVGGGLVESSFDLSMFSDIGELQELHSALEEAKADIVGLWALKFLISQDLLPKSLEKSMYVSFLAGCFRSVRFGLEEAHGKGQALQFNWLFEKEAFILHSDETFSVDFAKVEEAVESLSRAILTIQAKGDKGAANLLLQKYCKMTLPLKHALEKLESVQVPVDIAPQFSVVNEIAKQS
ncbi:unnamed protein product [Dovyalis caffra]|uniref:Nudix hydrolase domain-containing protein n=1 Tax=Dovyalis caffra TaxID=77055 RepID=A0AAV1RJG1_9ROSI|nr:unnamed protein product [Dovyalis caffra]